MVLYVFVVADFIRRGWWIYCMEQEMVRYARRFDFILEIS